MGKVSRKLQVTSTNNGKDVTKTFAYANTESSNAELATFANNLYGLSDNTVKNITLVDRQNITDAEPEVSGVTFNLNLDLFAQNPDFIKQGTDWLFQARAYLTNTADCWVNTVSLDDETYTLSGNYYDNQYSSADTAEAEVSATQNVFNLMVNGKEVTYNLGQWINFNSESLIADLNSQFTDTTISYSAGKLTFANDNALNIKFYNNYIISKQLEKYIGAKFYNTELPDGVTIDYSLQNYTVEVNLTDAGVTTLGNPITEISPSYTFIDSSEVQTEISTVNSEIMPLFNRVLAGDSDVAISNVSSRNISSMAAWAKEGYVGATDTWLVKPVRFGAGNGSVKFSAADFGISSDNWNNYIWTFIVKFGDNPICESNLNLNFDGTARFQASDVGNSTALIYLVSKK